jgi:predicted RNase H-like HicB family nuclease
MVLEIVVHKTDDGYTAEVPSLKGCESWAHDEDTVISKIVELVAYYLKTDQKEFKIDKARGSRTKTIYKLIFSKSET